MRQECLRVHRAISLQLLNSGCAYAVIRLLVFFVFSRRRNIPFVHGTPADLKDKKANQPTVPDAQVDQDSRVYVVLFRLAFNGEVPQCIGHVAGRLSNACMYARSAKHTYLHTVSTCMHTYMQCLHPPQPTSPRLPHYTSLHRTTPPGPHI